jgi:hypothetical protein
MMKMMKKCTALLILPFLISCATNKANDSPDRAALSKTISTQDDQAASDKKQDLGCKSSLKLEGTLFVESCSLRDKGCISAGKAVYDYSITAKFEPHVIGMYMQASPWHMYDGEMRILTVEEVAETAKSLLKDDSKRVDLIASWTGVAPDPNGKSLAQKLSDALNGFPVRGMDGFVWMAKDGSVRTTHQAFTITRVRRPYGVHPGDEVMVSLVEGWFISFEEDWVKERRAEGIMRVGAAYDVFMLCPDRALQSFEAAARLSNAIAEYNAALIRLERGMEGDREAAVALLSQAASLGDKEAKVRLEKLKRQGR